MGRDELVLVLPGITRKDLAEETSSLERVVVEAGLSICGEELLGLSVGAVLCSELSGDAESLLAESDRLMYLAKQAHKKAGFYGEALQHFPTGMAETVH